MFRCCFGAPEGPPEDYEEKRGKVRASESAPPPPPPHPPPPPPH